MRFELEGEPERVIRAGEAFWEPGGDVIHYQDGNRHQEPLSCDDAMRVPGQPMLTLVDEDELAQRKDHRAPRPTRATGPVSGPSLTRHLTRRLLHC